MSKWLRWLSAQESAERTSINLASDENLCFTNAGFNHRAVLGVIIYCHVLAVFNEFSRSHIPLIRDQ